jgi:hypothetical protein
MEQSETEFNISEDSGSGFFTSTRFETRLNRFYNNLSKAADCKNKKWCKKCKDC